ncbi:MAG: helix-turn-helix transcriptional regulator [Desulfatibacillaceae bacterium]|nr:helix-turn-helix transcriptional regulator [Desulfatibacillaceae bacterium]
MSENKTLEQLEKEINDHLDAITQTLEFKKEYLEFVIIDDIAEQMQRQNMSRAELARRMGVSRAAITKLLRYGSNLTIGRIVEFAEVLGCEVDLRMKPKKQVSFGKFSSPKVLSLKCRVPALKQTAQTAQMVCADDYISIQAQA